ncbi:hypothetical protein FACS189472_15890 [Alphaproteobacteria bacterium]|nr:hypothetical protein FACS189472_15890 [Alphaproteobacteria bacterium]
MQFPQKQRMQPPQHTRHVWQQQSRVSAPYTLAGQLDGSEACACALLKRREGGGEG